MGIGEVLLAAAGAIIIGGVTRMPSPPPAEECLALLRTAGHEERQLTGDWWDVRTSSLSIRETLNQSRRTRRCDPPTIPVNLYGQTLTHEFEPLATPLTASSYDMHLGAGRFEPFADMASIEDFVALIPVHSVGAALPAGGLSLPASLDYLTLLTRNLPDWDGEDFATRPELTTGARFMLPPKTVTEYQQRLSDVWTVINKLHVPAPSDQDNSQGSINMLERWLQTQGLETDLTHEAIQTIRRVGRLRQEFQHGSLEKQKAARRARAELGLPDIITDFEDAWHVITEGLAAAFMTIADAIRQGPPEHTA